MKFKTQGLLLSALSVSILSGCANYQSDSAYNEDDTQVGNSTANSQSYTEDKSRIGMLEAEIQRLQGSGLTPPNPKAGECYARVLTPARYETRNETIQTVAPSQRIQTTPARYENTTQRVVNRAESSRLEVIPATYTTVTETIVVQEASTRYETLPATYRNVTEQILIRAAHTEWKKGKGPIQKIDTLTGEIMCLVEVPATYRTITKRVLDTPTSVRTIEIPAKTQTITRRIIDQAATTRSIVIPATYKNVHIHKLVTPASQQTIELPGKTQTISKRIKVADSHLEWRSILCETNTTRGVIQRLQQALKGEGYNPGPIDGVLGSETLSATNAYQKANNLASGQLTIDTLKKLGVSL